MIGSAALLALATATLALGTGSVAVAIDARAAARTSSRAIRSGCARDAVLLDAARRLACAARESADAVRAGLVDAARTLAPAADGVLVYEQDDGTLRCTVAAGERFGYFVGTRVALGDGASLPARALAAGHRMTLADDGVAPLHPADGAALAVPLALETGRATVLVVAARTAFAAADVEAIVALADQASPAYLIAVDREHDRRRAEYDGLTGLLTPRALRQRLTALVDRARRLPSARLALVFVDTDRFKTWNDRYGHAAGDALLREIAGALRTAARSPDDLVARNGGDEFCLVFAGTDKSTAIERAETVRARIAALDLDELIPVTPSGDVRISASIGVAAFPADASSASDLLERADAAMYHAKNTGRDAVSYRGTDGAYARLEPPAVA